VVAGKTVLESFTFFDGKRRGRLVRGYYSGGKQIGGGIKVARRKLIFAVPNFFLGR